MTPRLPEPESPVAARCPASIMPGQRCSRPVAAGETLCENHLAMGSPPDIDRSISIATPD